MCSLYAISSYASEYVLDSSGFENSSSVSAWSLASDSDAEEIGIASNSNADIMPLASYGDVYEGSISSTVTNYMKGIVCRFSPSTHYVLFREGQYAYRLVYGENLEVDGSTFSGTDLKYIAYDSRYYTVSEGDEGDFALDVSSYTVYTDLESMYPVLYEGVSRNEGQALLFCAVVMLLFDIVKAFFGTGRHRNQF